MNILFIGVGYFPFLTAGEKNFFFRLIPLLNQHSEVTVISINDYHEEKLIQETAGHITDVFCFKRPFHTNYEQFFYQKSNYLAYHHRHKPVREILEKFSSVLIHTPKIRRIIHDHNIEVVHFMDNFGPSMPYLKRIFPQIKVTYSAANYDPRGRKARYDQYLKISLSSLDALGVYSNSYQEILTKIGIQTPSFLTRWGVSINQNILSLSEKKSIRTSLGIGEGEKFILWSGYLQQIQEADFYKALAVAHKVVEQEENIRFIFAFKPETYKDIYNQGEAKQIQILTGLENFGDVLETADFFFSPIEDKTSTVSPPLTWIEAMAKGTPIITTDILGVRELITDGIDGFVARDYKHLPEIISTAIASDLNPISVRSIRKVEQDFNIENSAEAYLGMWESLLTHE